jgi:hypothetical protein
VIQAIDADSLTLQVAGAWFLVEERTKIRSDCTHGRLPFEDLRVGQWVEVHGRRPHGDGGADGETLRARSIRILRRRGPHEELYGILEELDADSGRFTVSGVPFWSDACTEVEIAEEHGGLEDLAVGDRVEVEYAPTPDPDGYYAREIETVR